jgi:oxygen-dependent protoporphyrinogen oxidase
MSLKSCFPRIHEVESEYGSLIRGLIKLQRKARKAGSKDQPGPGPGGLLTSFEDGMSVLTDTLTNQLGARLRLNAAVASVSAQQGRYSVHLEDGVEEEVEALILAAPAHAQQAMLHDLSPQLAGWVGEIPYPPLAVICMGFDVARAGRILDGFGFLVPSREDRGILGTVVDSNVFPNRAPEGKVLLRTMVGGARVPQLAGLPDDQLIGRVRDDLADILDLSVEPEFISIYRHAKAIPQYLVGHADRLASIGQELEKHPGLVLTGNAFRGVSLNDCVLNAQKTAAGLFAAN